MRTFHEQFDDAQRVSIKLSYHGLNHYNSVVRLDWTPADALQDTPPGVIEDLAINSVREGTHHEKQAIQRSREDFQVSRSFDMEQSLKDSLWYTDAIQKFAKEINE